MTTGERACEAVGIDLGTTYSSLAYLDGRLLPRVVCDSSGQAVMPSCVLFDDDEIIVGAMALAQARLYADRVVQFIKLQMGEPWRKTFLGQEHTPESISALILGQLVKEARPQIGAISKAVITVPAFFTEKRRRATEQAGRIAGLDVIGTLNEPMAASLAYGLHHTPKEHFAVVYDLGGGTFDVTVVRVAPDELEEIATNGNRQLGGRDWDQALVDHVCRGFERRHRRDLRTSPQAMQDLQTECEIAKRHLGRRSKTAIRVQAFGCEYVEEVSRVDFEAMTADLLHATRLTTEIALEDARLDWSRVERVVLVGGSTHMPAVRELLYEMSGIPPDAGVNPVVAVSLGAAIYAHMLESGSAMKAIRLHPEVELDIEDEFVDPQTSTTVLADAPQAAAGPECAAGPERAAESESTAVPAAMAVPETQIGFHMPSEPPQVAGEPPAAAPRSIRFVTAHGVGLLVWSKGRLKNHVLIPRNTQVPATKTRRFTTRVPKKGRSGQAADQTLTLEITQGDTSDVELAERLGRGRIEGLPSDESGGNPVDVTMAFDAQGRLHARAEYVRTGQGMNVSLEVQGGLKEEEVAALHDYLTRSGFLAPFDATVAFDRLEERDR